MDRSNIEKIAKTSQEKMFLAKIWDKINGGIRKNIPANSPFLSPAEQEMCRYLFGASKDLHYFGGYSGAERQMIVYIPDYLNDGYLLEENSPVSCIRAEFNDCDCPTHRDFLGALTGLGLARETVGDICVSKGHCDFFVTAEMTPFILQNFTGAGRIRVRLSEIPLCKADIPEPEVRTIKDTLASMRLDNVISAGFRISRGLASQYVATGKASVNGIPCEKADKSISEGAKISLRGHGKICLAEVIGETKKGRISVIIHRYI